MSEMTPGRAAFEVAQARLSPENRLAWDKIKPLHREHWEEEARAAIKADPDRAGEVSRLRSIISEMTTAIRSQMDGKTEIRRAEVDDWEGRAGTGPGTDKEDSE